MMKHADVWRAIDRLAAKNGLSPSGLARRSGLDPTSFNKSKRRSASGKARWPSTESVAKVLAATSATLGEFVNLMGEESGQIFAQRFPLLSISECNVPERFSPDGQLIERGSDEVLFPFIGDAAAFALEVDSDAYAPYYRNGDVLLVSPQGDIRKGDRVAVGLKSGGVLIKRLTRDGVRKIELQALGQTKDRLSLPRAETAWLARIVWASQ